MWQKVHVEPQPLYDSESLLLRITASYRQINTNPVVLIKWDPAEVFFVLGSKNTFFFINDPFLALMSVVSTFCECSGRGQFQLKREKPRTWCSKLNSKNRKCLHTTFQGCLYAFLQYTNQVSDWTWHLNKSCFYVSLRLFENTPFFTEISAKSKLPCIL